MPSEDAHLIALLSPERAAIPDDGFSARVVAAVPRSPRREWLRPCILAGMTSAGCLLGVVVLPGTEGLRVLLGQLPYGSLFSALPIPWLLLAYLLCGVAVSIAVEVRTVAGRASPRAGPCG